VGRQRQVHSDVVALRTKVDALPKQLSATVQQQSHTDGILTCSLLVTCLITVCTE
jgi:metal-dependent amidase/aminoacylase/carboxypeptidase family protein